MLPYPNPYHFGISQEPQHPNPTVSSFPMPLDQQHYDHFFPGQGQYFNSGTLEAVLVRPPRAASEREAGMIAPQGASRNGVSGAGQQGHARVRKRPFRTDRHSKIRTAQGLRDRRMRLSLDVARDFFALQDRLGFDKASKTVDWLLNQSKAAIDRLPEPSHRSSGNGDDAAMSSLMSTAGIVKEPAAAGSGGGVEKVTSRNGASVFMDHGCELDGLVAAGPVLREYYYEFGDQMMSTNGREGDDDDDGEYDEDGDFLDGMQY